MAKSYVARTQQEHPLVKNAYAAVVDEIFGKRGFFAESDFTDPQGRKEIRDLRQKLDPKRQDALSEGLMQVVKTAITESALNKISDDQGSHFDSSDLAPLAHEIYGAIYRITQDPKTTLETEELVRSKLHLIIHYISRNPANLVSKSETPSFP